MNKILDERFYDETGELKSCFREKHKGTIKPLPDIFTLSQMTRCGKFIAELIGEYGSAYEKFDADTVKHYINGWWAQDQDSKL